MLGESKMPEKRTIRIGYGKEEISAELNIENLICELKANDIAVESTGLSEVMRALGNPIGTPKLRDIVSKGETVCIVTSDITRPCPSYIMLPPVIDELLTAGILLDDITIVFGLGSHRPHTEEEKRKLVGDKVYGRVKTIDSDPNDTVSFGITSRGTPVNITKSVANADRRVCLGNIEMHYFAGYSGGGKAIMPGVSDRFAIQANHSRMIEKTSIAGQVDNNGVRLDIEEAADMCGIDFILNVVLDEDKKICKAVAGDHRLAHREGCSFLDSMYKITIPELADIVIASPGGFPKDINIYQAQKALDNAQHAVKKGGIIILAAECAEGFGEEVFERWLNDAEQSTDLIRRVEKQFELGGHKAAAIAMVIEKCEVYFVSALKEDVAALTFMKPFANLQAALDKALEVKGKDSKIIVMSHAGSTLPVIGNM
jgi:nickel-dependent lactate racemase